MARVVCGIDGSERSLVALAHASVFARHFHHDLIALHIVNPIAEETIMPDRGRMRVAQQAAQLERSLTPVLSRFKARFRTVYTEPGEGTGQALGRAAAEEGAVLLALSSRGSVRLRRGILGSVTLDILGREHLPLLVVGPRVPAEPPGTSGYPMLWLMQDASGGGVLGRLLHPAIAPARSQVEVLQIDTMDEPDPRGEALFQGRLEALRRVAPATCQITGTFERLEGAHAVLPRVFEAAESGDVRAIALATSSHRLQRRLWGGSTALRLLADSPVPLIVVPRR